MWSSYFISSGISIKSSDMLLNVYDCLIVPASTTSLKILEWWRSKMMCLPYSTRGSLDCHRVTRCWHRTTGPMVLFRTYYPGANLYVSPKMWNRWNNAREGSWVYSRGWRTNVVRNMRERCTTGFVWRSSWLRHGWEPHTPSSTCTCIIQPSIRFLPAAGLTFRLYTSKR